MSPNNINNEQEKRQPRRLSPQASRLAALEAARELLIETGPQAVTLKAVATRIGRTHADLAEYLTKAICVTIGEAVVRMESGEMSPRQLADLIFDAFDKEGAGALASWMLLSGNEDALNPVVDTIHNLVDEITAGGHEYLQLHELTLELVLLALGDALLGGPLSESLGLRRESGREIASRRLEQTLSAWEKHRASKI
jgi:AcrR family transcriptional regulator